jgi:hypothetical protein
MPIDHAKIVRSHIKKYFEQYNRVIAMNEGLKMCWSEEAITHPKSIPRNEPYF